MMAICSLNVFEILVYFFWILPPVVKNRSVKLKVRMVVIVSYFFTNFLLAFT